MLDTARPGMSRREVDRGGGGRAMLVELSVMEQCCHTVMEVIYSGAGDDWGQPGGEGRDQALAHPGS